MQVRAENAILSGKFVDAEVDDLMQVLGQIGLADVRAFGLTWEDCEQLLEQLGYAAHVDVVAA